MEKFRWKTAGDFDLIEDLFDDNLVFVHITGFVTTKQEWMSELRSKRFRYDKIALKEASARVYGEVAVVTGKAAFTVNGGSVYKLVYTEVYVVKMGQWKLVNLHTTTASF
ncbi:nuclear transport factor 2 family protein [Pseudomonas sp. R37(2017)]|uniref:nuclear transport factor 2 family protein n=1 Tax=Pseudomonas sp. R37(2017) TaxID=1981685 RepID=UPI001302CF4A|nr:nuclear transport factor 2 family protein [Pseudomonas sp. R37(2017)]